MERTTMYGLGLGAIAIIVAVVALIMAMGSSGGDGDTAAMSGVSASISAQGAEIQALTTQISGLQSQLAGQADLSASVSALQQQVADASMSADAGMDSMDMERIDDLSADVETVSAALADIDRRVDAAADAAAAASGQSMDMGRIDDLGDDLSSLRMAISDLRGMMDDDDDGDGDAVSSDDIAALSMGLADVRMALEEVQGMQSMSMETDSSGELAAALSRLAWLERALGPAYTKAYVEEAIRRYDNLGRYAALDYYNSPESLDGDLFLMVLDEDFRVLVDPIDQCNISADIRAIGTDITGYNYGAEFVTADENGKWVDYITVNPANDFQYERKHAWVIRHENLIFGSGWFERDVTIASEDAPANYTRALVQQAISRYDNLGREDTVAHYNMPESVHGQWYVFIADENDVVLSHVIPENVGKPLDEIVSPNGYPAGSQVAGAAAEGGAWTTYSYLNAATDMVETKHSWVVRHDGLIFGSGWYETGASKSDPAEYAQALVQGAADLYDAVGLEDTVAYYNSPESVDGPWYVFVLRASDLRTYANGARPELVDIDPPARIDAAGYAYGEAFATATSEGKWVSYVFLNPETNMLDSKHSWVMEHDGLIFGSGWYAGPADYTKYLVNEALDLYEGRGLNATVDRYNDPASLDGQWYVFVVGEDGKTLAHYDDELRGKDLNGPLGTDVNGYNFGAAMLSATEEGKWVSYVFNNPATGMPGSKHSWVVKRDGLIFGSGWYTDPAEYTKLFVERTLALYEAEGIEGVSARYDDPASVDGQWYTFVANTDGDTVVHYDADIRGQNLNTDFGTDVNGYNFGADILSATEDGKWVSYVFNNPATGELGSKHSWVVKRGDLLFGSGWYTDPAEYTKNYVDRAIALYDAEGLDAAVEYYNDPMNVEGQWYAFIVESDGEIISHYDPMVRGDNWLGDVGTDIDGNVFGGGIVSAPEEGRWVPYIFKNPVNGEQEPKLTWAIKHDGLVFAAGWYMDFAEYTKIYVDRAIALYEAEGLASAVSFYNNPDNVEGQWYAFIVETDGDIISHYDPDVRGDNWLNDVGTDINGNVFGDDIVYAPKEGQWVPYVFLNPVNGALESKMTWAIRHDGLVFAAGWYESE